MELSPYPFSSRLFFAGIALFACLILGSRSFRAFFAVPVLGNYLRHLLQTLDARLNRSTRSDSERKIRGAVMLLAMLLLCGFVAAGFSALTATHRWGWLAEAFLLALFVPARLIFDEGNGIYRHLGAKNLAEAREEVQRITLQDAQSLDMHGLARATMEYMAGGLAERVVSPLFWYILLGLPGFVAGKIITEAALLLAYDSRRHRHFGRLAGALERVLNFFPARFAGLLLAVAALFVPGASPRRAFSCMAKDSEKIALPRKGFPIAATAGALGITLGGARSVQGHLVKDGWVGAGSAKTGLPDLRKNLLLYAIACLLNAALVAILLAALAR